MLVPFDQATLDGFEQVLVDPPPAGKQKEQVVQDYLEAHPEMIPTPNLLNHHLHLEMVISKFPLDTALKTDLAYITKSSGVWRITFVELEQPDKPVFKGDAASTVPAAEFTAALSQVRDWRVYVDENKADVLRRLSPLLVPATMRENPTEFQYILVIGRSSNTNASAVRKKALHRLATDSDVAILTYDSVANWYRHGERYSKNITRLSGTRYAFKQLHHAPTTTFAWVGCDALTLDSGQVEYLRGEGYDIDRWLAGEYLGFNGKQVVEIGLSRVVLPNERFERTP